MSKQSGQTLLEVVVALAIGIVVVTGFVSLAVVSVRNSQFSTNKASATNLAEEGIEAMITIRDLNTDGAISGATSSNWQGLVGTTLGGPCPSDPAQACPNNDFRLSDCSFGNIPQHCIMRTSTPETINTIFSRKIQITDSGTNVKNITVVVWWTDTSGQHASVLSRKLHKDKLE